MEAFAIFLYLIEFHDYYRERKRFYKIISMAESQ